ncbi:MAG: DUF1194 domain-containing protein [Pseudomonadota bacterium]
MLRPLALATLLISAPPAAACDVALALAIDVSGSVNPDEYALQMDGLADALSDSAVGDALIRTRAAVTVVQWTGASRQQAVVPWRRIEDDAALSALVAEVRAVRRVWRHFSTGIGEALVFTAELFDQVGDCARRVIDVSGDGRSNEGLAPEEVKDHLAAQGFQINALAIEGSEPDLTDYFRQSVVAGRGAFVYTALGFEDYPEKIRRKLLDELTIQVSRRP